MEQAHATQDPKAQQVLETFRYLVRNSKLPQECLQLTTLVELADWLMAAMDEIAPYGEPDYEIFSHGLAVLVGAAACVYGRSDEALALAGLDRARQYTMSLIDGTYLEGCFELLPLSATLGPAADDGENSA